jgi:hypothetical protein
MQYEIKNYLCANGCGPRGESSVEASERMIKIEWANSVRIDGFYLIEYILIESRFLDIRIHEYGNA